MRWDDPEIPAYHMDTDEIVYKDATGNEIKREKFDAVYESNGDRALAPDSHPSAEAFIT
jgi:hypothetical protein